MTAVAEGVVVTAQNGRIFRLAPGVLGCAQDLLAGVDAAQIAQRHCVAEQAVLALGASLRDADVQSLSVIDQEPRQKRFQAKGFSALQLTVWYPGATFVRLQPLWARVTGTGAQVLVTVLSLMGIALGLSSISTGELPSQIGLWEGVIVLLSTLLLTSLHELGHVIALGAYGMPARRVGIMLFYGSMAMFSDVTPAWSLPRREERLRVIWWGLLVTAAEAGACGAAALITGSDLVGLIFIGLIATLIVNLVPLARFDGYYLLILSRNSPRLRDLSVSRFGQFLVGRFAASKGAGAAEAKTARSELLFGAASIAYGCLLWATVLVQTLVSVLEADGIGLRLTPPPLLPIVLLAAAMLAGYTLITVVRLRKVDRRAGSPTPQSAPADAAGATAPEAVS